LIFASPWTPPLSDVLAARDPDDLRVTILLYLPIGTPLDMNGLGTLAKTFSDYFPETLVKAVRGITRKPLPLTYPLKRLAPLLAVATPLPAPLSSISIHPFKT